MLKSNTGTVILLMGLSGAGKTTLSYRLKDIMVEKNKRPVMVLDGDIVREFFEKESGYSPDERFFVTRQIAFGAYLLAENGIDVIVANIAGESRVREFLDRKWLRWVQIFLDVDVDLCIKHDPKGVYKRNMELKHPQLLGVDLEYERPDNPDVTVYPYKESVEESLSKIVGFLAQKGILLA